MNPCWVVVYALAVILAVGVLLTSITLGFLEVVATSILGITIGVVIGALISG